MPPSIPRQISTVGSAKKAASRSPSGSVVMVPILSTRELHVERWSLGASKAGITAGAHSPSTGRPSTPNADRELKTGSARSDVASRLVATLADRILEALD